MRTIGIFLLLSLAPATTLGEPPESIIGAWNFDMVRTMNEHIDRVVQARPDSISLETAEIQKAALANLAEKSTPQTMIIITKDTITSTSANVASTTRPYSVIGGNSRLMIIESRDGDGYESVVNIRLVESGIAIETTNCQEKPEQCQRAMEQFKKRRQANPSKNIVLSDEPKLDGLISSPPLDEMSQPRWIYFTRVKNE